MTALRVGSPSIERTDLPPKEVNLNKEFIKLFQVFQESLFKSQELARQGAATARAFERNANSSKYGHMRTAAICSGGPLAGLLFSDETSKQIATKLVEGTGTLFQVQGSVNGELFDISKVEENACEETIRTSMQLVERMQQQIAALIKA